MNRSLIKLKNENLFVLKVNEGYILSPTPSLFEDDEVAYILQELEDIIINKKTLGIEIIRTNISTSKKKEFSKFEDLEIRQVKLNIIEE